MEGLILSHLELMELRYMLNKEIAELPHLKEHNWQPEKVDYDAVKPKILEEIKKILEKTDESKYCLSNIEKIWNFIRYGAY